MKILVKVFLEKGIYDDDEFLLSNKFHFKSLAQSNLINKVQIDENRLKWVVNPKLVEINERILTDYNLSMEDYIRPIYSLPFRKNLERGKAHQKDEFAQFIDENKTSLEGYLESLNVSLKIYHKADSLSLPKINKSDISDLVNDWKTSLSQLSICVFRIEEIINYSGLQPDLILLKWEDYWRYPESLKRFNDELRIFDGLKEQIPLLRGCFLEAYNDLFCLFENLHKMNRRMHISLVNLADKEIELFFRTRKLFLVYSKQNYFDLLEGLTKYLEEKARTFMFLIMQMLYGNRKNRLNQIKNTSVKVYIDRLGENSEENMYNEFENLNRGQYKSLFLESPNLKVAIFNHVFGMNYKSNYSSFFESFCDFNIITSHLKKGSISSQLESKIYSYIITAADFIRRINIAYRYLIDKHFYIENETDSRVTCYFSLRGINNGKTGGNSFVLNEMNTLKDISELQQIELDVIDIARIKSTIKNSCESCISGKMYLDFDDNMLIEQVFGVGYREFISILAYLKYSKAIDILWKRGTSFAIKIASHP